MIDTPLRLSETAGVWQQIGAETVLLDIRASEYLGLNPSGTVLWAALANGTTRTDLICMLTKEFGIPPQTAEQDVDAFVQLCEAHGFITTG